MKLYQSFTALALGATVLASVVAAQGIVIDRRVVPEPIRPRVQRAQNIRIKAHKVEVQIDGQSATTTVTQTFHNPNSWQMEGQYLFPLPEEAAISEFRMTMNGEMVKGELLDAKIARTTYERIVARMIDPGLLEYAGRGLFKARVFPIPANDDLTIKFTYSELLPYDSGLVRYRYPLRTEHYSAIPVDSVGMTVKLTNDQGLRTIYSPTHTMDIARNADKQATVGMELTKNQPKTDFELYFATGDGAMNTNVLSYRSGKESGYFLALVTPKIKLDASDILPKDVIVVLDTSGSMMHDGKMDQAKKALKFFVNKLNAKDRFGIVSFSTTSRPMHETLVEANNEAKSDALAKIESLEATGGTNFHAAIQDAMKIAGGDSNRPCYVVVLTDGIPTVGEITDVKQIAKDVKTSMPKNVRLFSFGVGNDVNTWLLDTLAENGRGQREYVKPKENLEVKISNFANKISSPVLANVTMKLDGAVIHDQHPQFMPDVFAGEQISVLGRFDKPGKHQLVIEGEVNGEKRAFEYSVDLAVNATDKAYLPRMWAVRRVGFLMDQVRQNGENKELRDEIVRLGTKFGIVTPYTSFLIVDDSELGGVNGPRPEGARRDRNVFGGDGRGVRTGSPAEAPSDQKGEDSVDASKSNADRRHNDTDDEAREVEEKERAKIGGAAAGRGQSLRRAKRAEALKKDGASEAEAAAKASQVIKTVGDRSFVWSNDVWIESDLTNGELFSAVKVEYLSDRYFEISRRKDGSSKILALGTEVILRVDGDVIRIVDNTTSDADGKEDSKDADSNDAPDSKDAKKPE